MPVEVTPGPRMDGKYTEKASIIECRKILIIEDSEDVGYSEKNEKCVKSWDVEPPKGSPGLGSSKAEGCAGSKSSDNSFSSRSQNGMIYEGRKDAEGGLRASDSSQPLNGGNFLQSSEAEGVSGKSDGDPRDCEVVKGMTHSGIYKEKTSSFKSYERAPGSEGADLNLSSETGASVEDGKIDEFKKKAQSEIDGKSFMGKLPFSDVSSKYGESPRTNGENAEGVCEREPEEKKVFEGRTRASAGNGVNGLTLEDIYHAGVTSFDSSQAGLYLEDRLPEESRNGNCTHRSSDAGVSFDGKLSEKSFGSPSRHEDHHHRHSRGSGAGIPNPALVERLYNPPHVCNHVRCAANNPDYATKQAIPPKKYLVSKKHLYGGVIDKSRRTSCDHDGGSAEKSRRTSCDHDGRSAEKSRRASYDHDGGASEKARKASYGHDGGFTEKTRRTSCDYNGGSSGKSRRSSRDHDKSYVPQTLMNTAVIGGKSRNASGDSDKSLAVNTPAGNSRSSVDSDLNHPHSTSEASHHKRGKSTPPGGFTSLGTWNSSVALDKKHGGNGFWSSTIGVKKHEGHGGWNSSVALDKTNVDYYYGPWNGSVAIDRKAGERKDKSRSNLPEAAKNSSKVDILHRSHRTSPEFSVTEDRRRKPRRSSIASEVGEGTATPNSRRLSDRAEKPNGSASPSVSDLNEETRTPPETSSPEEARDGDSPSASVGSNHTDQSGSKVVSWQRSQNSPNFSCVTSSDSPSCESLSSITRGPDGKAVSRARYELPTVSSKLPRLSSGFSSQSPSESNSGTSALCKPSWNASTSRTSLGATSTPTVASVANTSVLARNFITKLKESSKTAAAKVPALPSWNSSITVAPNLFDYSTNGSGSSKVGRIAEAKQSSKARRVVTGPEGQVDGKSQSDKPTHPENNAAFQSKETGSTVPKEMVVPIPESSAEKHVDPGSVVSIPSTPTSKLTRYGSMRDSATNIPTPNKFSRTLSIKEKEKESKVPSTLKFGKRGRTMSIPEARKNETVNLKKGETAERRLSEEYMTDHTLTTTVSREVQGGRVKSLVHAFESLKTGPDAEHHHSADETVRCEYERELAALAHSSSPIPA